MNVYPSRRTAAYPPRVYDAVKKNAETAEVVLTGKGTVENSRVGPAFPIPSSGIEAVWNHDLRWRGIRVTRASYDSPTSFGEGIQTIDDINLFNGPPDRFN